MLSCKPPLPNPPDLGQYCEPFCDQMLYSVSTFTCVTAKNTQQTTFSYSALHYSLQKLDSTKNNSQHTGQQNIFVHCGSRLYFCHPTAKR